MSKVESLRARDTGHAGPDWSGGGGGTGDTPFLIDLSSLFQLLWRRKNEIVGTAVVVTLLAALAIWQITPTYTASSKVMIEARHSQVVDIEAVMSGLSGDVETIQSEIEVIRSRGLMSKVGQKLQLGLDPEFNSALRPDGGLAAMLDLRNVLPEDWAALLLGPEPNNTVDPAAAAESLEDRVVDTLLGRITVAPVGRSRVIEIKAESQSPRRAAELANTVAELYVVSQLEAKFEATQRANAWLSERLAELRAKVEASDQAVEAYRRQAGIVEGQNVSLTQEQISQLSAQLVVERAKRVEAEARLRQVGNLLNSPDGAQSASEVLSNRLIVSLREQEAEVKRKVAELSQEYGEKHPRMINARAELEDLQGKIGNEVGLIVEGLRNEVAVARAREASMQSSLEGLKAEAADVNTSEVQLRALQREAEANRTLLETFLARSKETENQDSFLEADARILSAAAVPKVPSAPRRTLLLALAILAGVALGVLLAFLIELIDRGFHSLEEVEKQLDVQGLGLLPAVVGLLGMSKTPEEHLLAHGNSAYAEAVRSVRTAIALDSRDRPAKVILVASSLPREGKTATALSLAYHIGGLGNRVILLDCDLRRPSVHKSHKTSLVPGLTELLNGERQLEEVIRRHEPSGADFITAGAAAADPPGLLSSTRMNQLLSRLTERYDMVVIDSAPVLAVSDTRALCRLTDKTLFLVRWGETRRDVARLGLRRLREAGADVAGVALSAVDMHRMAQYGYSDAAYYDGGIRKYYNG